MPDTPREWARKVVKRAATKGNKTAQKMDKLYDKEDKKKDKK